MVINRILVVAAFGLIVLGLAPAQLSALSEPVTVSAVSPTLADVLHAAIQAEGGPTDY